jgi:exo-beta-1,3-glucanase (GH17 family)
MWGIAYTAQVSKLLSCAGSADKQGSIPPNCGATQANVTRDMQLLSQLTTRIRLYSANCNITAMVLEGIKAAKVDMKIWPAICKYRPLSRCHVVRGSFG